MPYFIFVWWEGYVPREITVTIWYPYLSLLSYLLSALLRFEFLQFSNIFYKYLINHEYLNFIVYIQTGNIFTLQLPWYVFIFFIPLLPTPCFSHDLKVLHNFRSYFQCILFAKLGAPGLHVQEYFVTVCPVIFVTSLHAHIIIFTKSFSSFHFSFLQSPVQHNEGKSVAIYFSYPLFITWSIK